jgi:hypothetical protein
MIVRILDPVAGLVVLGRRRGRGWLSRLLARDPPRPSGSPAKRLVDLGGLILRSASTLHLRGNRRLDPVVESWKPKGVCI